MQLERAEDSECSGRKEFALKPTNSQTWNESLSINHYPAQFFTRGRRNSIERSAKLQSSPQCGVCGSQLRSLLSRWSFWPGAHLRKRMPTPLTESQMPYSTWRQKKVSIL